MWKPETWQLEDILADIRTNAALEKIEKSKDKEKYLKEVLDSSKLRLVNFIAKHDAQIFKKSILILIKKERDFNGLIAVWIDNEQHLNNTKKASFLYKRVLTFLEQANARIHDIEINIQLAELRQALQTETLAQVDAILKSGIPPEELERRGNELSDTACDFYVKARGAKKTEASKTWLWLVLLGLIAGIILGALATIAFLALNPLTSPLLITTAGIGLTASWVIAGVTTTVFGIPAAAGFITAVIGVGMTIMQRVQIRNRRNQLNGDISEQSETNPETDKETPLKQNPEYTQGGNWSPRLPFWEEETTPEEEETTLEEIVDPLDYSPHTYRE